MNHRKSTNPLRLNVATIVRFLPRYMPVERTVNVPVCWLKNVVGASPVSHLIAPGAGTSVTLNCAWAAEVGRRGRAFHVAPHARVRRELPSHSGASGSVGWAFGGLVQ